MTTANKNIIGNGQKVLVLCGTKKIKAVVCQVYPNGTAKIQVTAQGPILKGTPYQFNRIAVVLIDLLEAKKTRRSEV